MPNDRGTIKWTSLMLPEHVEMLKELWAEEEKTTMPKLDQQELECINQIAQTAYCNKESVQISIFHNGKHQFYQGKILKMNPLKSTLQLQLNGQSTPLTCYFNQIIGIELL